VRTERPQHDYPTTPDAATDTTAVLGLQCSWCGRLLRDPVGYPDADHHVAWTHGICPDCQRAAAAPRESAAPPSDERRSLSAETAVAVALWLRGFRMHMSIVAACLTFGIGILAFLAVMRALLLKRTARRLDLGTVSNQWIVENRVGSREDR